MEKKKKSIAGFTLIEMMIVISIIAMVMGLVTSNVMNRYKESQITGTRIQIKQIINTLDDFRRVCGFYPTTEQGLDALVKAPAGRTCKNYDPEGFMKHVPQDAWGNDFVYTNENGHPKIMSYGASGKEGNDPKQILSSDDTSN